ncbi:MAG: phosphotransferase [Chloroflexi bacterium]|nr:phosphotransferase [Chloroflexota bacterium]MXX80015.1 phosphotransferase [Chloroflexota bacterium]MYB23374.1 phosphotransferase [Chloroflexota bacterium]MYD16888.1 phosphotransferase [Chloroflexota bacterium]MYF21948.1 phosphotransferase [Chloroflexota bacterium]
MPESVVASDLRTRYAFALQGRFPELSVEQLRLDLKSGGDIVVVEWNEWQALFPRSEGGAEQLAAVAAVMPHLRGFLSPAIPLWDVSSDGVDWSRSWRAARLPEGRPLHPELIVDQNRERLVRELAGFFHELHSFSVERARSLGAASFRSWRDEHEALARRAQTLLRPLLSWSEMTWARRWWSRFLDDQSIWNHEPALIHGGIDAECLLVDPLVRELTAVTSWQRVRVADPALDFAALVDAYGADLGWRIVEHYGSLGSVADASLFRRIRLQQTVRRFREVVAAADRDGPESEAMTEAIKRLR